MMTYTHPDRHCCDWLSFTAKIQTLDNNCEHNGQNADANKKQEIYNCNMKEQLHHLFWVINTMYIGWSETVNPSDLSITLPNVNRFAQLFFIDRLGSKFAITTS